MKLLEYLFIIIALGLIVFTLLYQHLSTIIPVPS